MLNESALNEILESQGFTNILAEQYVPGQEGYELGGYEGAFTRNDREYGFAVTPVSAEIHLSDDRIQGPVIQVWSQGRTPETTLQALLDLFNSRDLWSIPSNT